LLDAAGFVLAGGRSSRMGADKALLPLSGKPLIAHALAILHQAGLPASIAGARSPLSAFAPVIPDSNPDQGPLGGICAALASTSARWAVFLPVDLPLLPAALVTYLLHSARATGQAVTLASVNGFAQTFPVVLDHALLPLLQAELEAGRCGCYSAFQAAASRLAQPLSVLDVDPLVQSGQVAHPEVLPPARWFLNVNSPADLLGAEVHRPTPIA
jgi:molybdopterin-guanine dinucleotide biosynthesis protein A